VTLSRNALPFSEPHFHIPIPCDLPFMFFGSIPEFLIGESLAAEEEGSALEKGLRKLAGLRSQHAFSVAKDLLDPVAAGMFTTILIVFACPFRPHNFPFSRAVPLLASESVQSRPLCSNFFRSVLRD